MADHNSPPVSPVSSDGSGNQTFFSAAHDLRLRLEDMAHVVDNPEVATAAGDETVDMQAWSKSTSMMTDQSRRVC